jgi:hypothetical protein
MGTYDEELTDDQIAYAHERAADRRAIWRDHMDKTTALKKSAAKYIAPIDPVELAVRLAESYNEMKRPVGATGMQAFVTMEQEAQDAWLRTANTAMRYWQECIASANTAQ